MITSGIGLNKICEQMGHSNHTHDEDRLQDRLAALSARDPVPLCKTDLAQIFQVTLPDGTPGVLKVYHGSDMANEEPGIGLLQAAKGVAAVDIVAKQKDAILMRYLEGPSLGDISRAGDDAKANLLLIEGIAQLHDALPQDLGGMVTLNRQFRDLFALDFGPNCPSPLRQNMARATELAKDLLADPKQTRPLHGDVHHDNAILTKDGVKFIDAKGLIGDPGFEMANSFRNPQGSDDTVLNPDRARHMAQIIAPRLNVDPQRQLAWAAAKCALSIAWNAGKTLNHDDAEHTCLSMLIALSDERL